MCFEISFKVTGRTRSITITDNGKILHITKSGSTVDYMFNGEQGSVECEDADDLALYHLSTITDLIHDSTDNCELKIFIQETSFA